LSIDTNMMQV